MLFDLLLGGGLSYKAGSQTQIYLIVPLSANDCPEQAEGSDFFFQARVSEMCTTQSMKEREEGEGG